MDWKAGKAQVRAMGLQGGDAGHVSYQTPQQVRFYFRHRHGPSLLPHEATRMPEGL